MHSTLTSPLTLPLPLLAELSLDTPFLGNPLRQWAIVLGTSIAAYVVLRIVLAFVRGALKRLAKHSSTIWDDLVVEALGHTRFLLAFPAVFLLIARGLAFPEGVDPLLASVGILLLLIQAGLWAAALLRRWFDHYRERRMAADPASVTGFAAITFIGQLIIWSIVLLLALDNFGVDVTALVAGLGVGGIAVALALQNVLGDLFASLSIVLDKPFVLGDFIAVGDLLGTVEAIGLKTTRIRSLSGEQLVFSNTDLLTSRLRNYGRMRERRVVFKVGVIYETPTDRLERVPGLLREAVEAQSPTRFDRAHFQSYGGSALVFETVYHVLDRDYNRYMDIQQAINLELHRRFEAEGIGFAYPTRTLHVHQVGGPAGAPAGGNGDPSAS